MVMGTGRVIDMATTTIHAEQTLLVMTQTHLNTKKVFMYGMILLVTVKSLVFKTH